MRANSSQTASGRLVKMADSANLPQRAGISRKTASGRLGGYLSSGADFRRASEAINGLLNSFLRTVVRLPEPTQEKAASYG